MSSFTHGKLDVRVYCEWLSASWVGNRTFGNRTQSNAIERNRTIKFDYVRQSNKIEPKLFSEYNFRNLIELFFVRFCSIYFDVFHLFVFKHYQEQQNHSSRVSAFIDFSKYLYSPDIRDSVRTIQNPTCEDEVTEDAFIIMSSVNQTFEKVWVSTITFRLPNIIEHNR